MEINMREVEYSEVGLRAARKMLVVWERKRKYAMAPTKRNEASLAKARNAYKDAAKALKSWE